MKTTGELRSHDAVVRQWLLLLNRLPFLPANRAINICIAQCHQPSHKPKAKIWTGDSLFDGNAGFRGNPLSESEPEYDAFLYQRPISEWIKLVNFAS